jgi:hypothetical protein
MGINRITKIGKSTYIPYRREFYFQNYRIISFQVSLVFYVMFCRSLFVLSYFSFGHCIVFPSSIYGFWLPLWYLQTFPIS